MKAKCGTNFIEWMRFSSLCFAPVVASQTVVGCLPFRAPKLALLGFFEELHLFFVFSSFVCLFIFSNVLVACGTRQARTWTILVLLVPETSTHTHTHTQVYEKIPWETSLIDSTQTHSNLFTIRHMQFWFQSTPASPRPLVTRDSKDSVGLRSSPPPPISASAVALSCCFPFFLNWRRERI